MCTMGAFSPDERRRYQALRATVMDAVQQVMETPRGFRVCLPGTIAADEIAEWIGLEQRCCPFLELSVHHPSGDTSQWLDLEGGAGVKELLRAEFVALRAPTGPAR